MKYLLNSLFHLNLTEMPETEYSLFNAVAEIKDGKLRMVRRKDVINNLKN